MGLPIAIGTKSVSSYPISSPEPIEEYADDGTILYPALLLQIPRADHDEKDDEHMRIPLTQGPLVVLAQSWDQWLQATVTVSFYDMIREDNQLREYTVAEIHVQISLSGEPFSSACRDAVYHIPLPEPPQSHHSSSSGGTTSPAVVFSSDRRFLACLIPHPKFQHQTCVIVFQLRRPRASSTSQPKSAQAAAPFPALPSYITPHQHHHAKHISTSAAQDAQDQTPPTAATTSSGTDSSKDIPVATNPKILRFHESKEPFGQATSLCSTAALELSLSSSAPPTSDPLLMVGCRSGSVMVASFRPLVVAGTLYEGRMDVASVDINNDGGLGSAICALSHCLSNGSVGSSKDKDHTDLDGGSIDNMNYNDNDTTNGGGNDAAGKLVAIRNDGTATIFETHMFTAETPSAYEPAPVAAGVNGGGVDDSSRTIGSTQTQSSSFSLPSTLKHAAAGDLLIGIEPVWELPGSFVAARWISGSSYLALLELERSSSTGNGSNKSVVRVWGLYDQGRAEPVSTLEVTAESLHENAHNTFVINDQTKSCSDEHVDDTVQSRDVRLWIYGTLGIEYDDYSGCLAVSSVLIKGDEHSLANANTSTNGEPCPFVCIWNWRTNIEGLTVTPSSSHKIIRTPGVSLVSRLFFAKDERGRSKFSHVIASVDPRIRKELYETGILSPPCDTYFHETRIREANSLLLSSSSVSYPHISKASATGDYEVEWRESSIPSGYLSCCGPPIIATVGRRWAKCIAVASSRGICSLDCSASTPSKSLTRMDSKRKLKATSEKLRHARSNPRWHLFGNEAEERSFRVLAMKWWEGCETSTDERFSDSILVAVIYVEEGNEKGYYLSCWSHRMLDMNHQLLRPASDSVLGYRWGIRLPNSFSPAYLEVLEQPASSKALPNHPPSRKAVVVLADSSASTHFQVFQMQVFPRKTDNATSYAGRKAYAAIARFSASGSIGYSASIFLASASFRFDLHPRKQVHSSDILDDKYVATCGAIRAYGGGVDALIVSEAGVLSTKSVLDPVNSCQGSTTASELSRYWLANIVTSEDIVSFAWILQLANGRLMCWTVPCITDHDAEDSRSEPATVADGSCVIIANHVDLGDAFVPQSFPYFGTTCPAGSTSTWMQQSSAATNYDFSLGCVPGSRFGCILSAGQACRKLHRSLCDDFERDLFRPDFLDHDLLSPTDFVLSPPAYIASVFAMILDAVGTQTASTNGRDVGPINGQILLPSPEGDSFRDSTMMALQLLVLRSVEKVSVTTNGDDSQNSAKDLFRVVVDFVRHCTTPLQFATLFVEVGRKIEPSYHPHLFPVPIASIHGGSSTTTDDLFDLLLENGSVSMPVAALPLFTNRETTRTSCAAIFHRCVDLLDVSHGNGAAMSFDVYKEERRVIGDIFRYGLKLEDPEDDDDSASKSSFTADNSTSDDEDQVRGYSMMCGMSRLFGGGRRFLKTDEQAIVDAASSFIVHGFDEHLVEERLALLEPAARTNGTGKHSSRVEEIPHVVGHNRGSQTVAGVAARYLLAIIFADKTPDRPSGWKMAAETASLLVGESLTGFYTCSRGECMDLVRQLSSTDVKFLLTAQPGRAGGLVAFLVRSIQECEQEIDAVQASKVLDLILILLARQEESQDFAAEIPGLIVAAVVVAHAADRTTDILTEDSDSQVCTSYLEARFELDLPISTVER
jgi:hypothetical protein